MVVRACQRGQRELAQTAGVVDVVRTVLLIGLRTILSCRRTKDAASRGGLR